MNFQNITNINTTLNISTNQCFCQYWTRHWHIVVQTYHITPRNYKLQYVAAKLLLCPSGSFLTCANYKTHSIPVYKKLWVCKINIFQPITCTLPPQVTTTLSSRLAELLNETWFIFAWGSNQTVTGLRKVKKWKIHIISGCGCVCMCVCASESAPIGESYGVGAGCPRNWQSPLTLPPRWASTWIVTDQGNKTEGRWRDASMSSPWHKDDPCGLSAAPSLCRAT